MDVLTGIWSVYVDVRSFPAFRRAPVNRRRVCLGDRTSTQYLRHRRKWRQRLWRHARPELWRRQRPVLGGDPDAEPGATHVRSAVPQLCHPARQKQGVRAQLQRRKIWLPRLCIVRWVSTFL